MLVTVNESHYDVGAIKQRLQNFKETSRDLEMQLDRLQMYIESIESPGSPTISDMPKSPSPDVDKFTVKIAKKIDLENCIRSTVAVLEDEKSYFETVLSHIRKADEKAVIRFRYFDSLNWNKIAEIMFGSNSLYDEKQDTYLRRVHKLHGSALLNMAIYIEDCMSYENR